MTDDHAPRTVWTIGHSTHSSAEFIALLQQAGIGVLVDVRHFPGSRRLPHFNREVLRARLAAAGLGYVHLVDLGGRREARADSPNRVWRSAAFRGYADHMETAPFHAGIAAVVDLAGSARPALMCAEGKWCDCHRSLIADHLKAAGHRVLHIQPGGGIEEHPYTAAARIVAGRLSYAGGRRGEVGQLEVDFTGSPGGSPPSTPPSPPPGAASEHH